MDRHTRAQRKEWLIKQGTGFRQVTCHITGYGRKGKYGEKQRSGDPARPVTIYIRVGFNGMRSEARSTGIVVANKADFDTQSLVIAGDPVNTARLAALKNEIVKVFNERLLMGKSLNPRFILDIALGLATHQDEEYYLMGRTSSGLPVLSLHKPKPKIPTILGAITDYNRIKAKLEGNGLGVLSRKRYEQYGRILTQFVTETYGKNALLEALTPAVEYDLFAYLKGTKKYVHNYAVKIIQFFKSMLTYAHAHRWVDRNVLAALRLSRHHKEVKTLTMADLEKLASRDFVEVTLNQVRDVFLFCCYTGLAYTDVESLAAEHIVRIDEIDCILKDRNKSGVQSFVPLFPEAIALLNRYKDHRVCRLKGVLLPVISNTKMNSALKIIGNIVGIQETLHTHLARKTFTMFAEERGFGLDQMATMLGHTRTTMTEQHYYKRRREPVLKVFKAIYPSGELKRLAS
ncbi:site-specific integrase [Spirosoma endbachense]|nr:site-specific integrase [Spirosoma endbachense]